MMSDKDKNRFFSSGDFINDGEGDDLDPELFLEKLEEQDNAVSKSKRPAGSKGKGSAGPASTRVSITVTFGSDKNDDEDEDELEDDEEIELDRDYSLDAKLQEYQQRIDAMIDELHQILDAEEEFVDDGYYKYGETDRYEQAENNVNNLEDAISNLEEASINLGMAST